MIGPEITGDGGRGRDEIIIKKAKLLFSGNNEQRRRQLFTQSDADRARELGYEIPEENIQVPPGADVSDDRSESEGPSYSDPDFNSK